MAPLKIVIVGGGIGGPAAAAGLARNGHDVTLYERMINTTEVGFAFRITANSDRCLQYLGIDTVAGGAVAANMGMHMTAEGKASGAGMKENTKSDAKKGVSVFAYRPQLNNQLLQVAVGFGAKIKNGVKVVRVDVEKTTLELDSGEQVSADLIIGADGVTSMIRPSIVDTSKYYPKPSTGNNAIRFMVSSERLMNEETMKGLVDDKTPLFSWSGFGKFVIVYPVDYGKQFNVVCTHPQDLSDQQVDSSESSTVSSSYNQEVSLTKLKSIYSEFEPRVHKLMDLANSEGFRLWKLMDLDDIPQWSQNRTTLLGDAGHVVEPFGFSGASMAIEDAVTLTVLFGKTIEPGNGVEIQRRLALYERLRKPRVSRVRDTSRLQGTSPNMPRMKDYMEWLCAHDVVGYTQDAMKQEL